MNSLSQVKNIDSYKMCQLRAIRFIFKESLKPLWVSDGNWLDVYSSKWLIYKVYLCWWVFFQTLRPWTKAEAPLRQLQSWPIKVPLGLLWVYDPDWGCWWFSIQIYLSLPRRKSMLGLRIVKLKGNEKKKSVRCQNFPQKTQTYLEITYEIIWKRK